MPHRRLPLAALSAATLLAAAAPLRAQADSAHGAHRAATPEPDPLCWRGRPQERCRAFLLVELAAPRHLAGTMLDPAVARRGSGHRRWDQGLASQFSYDVGGMVNVRPRDAIGGTITVGTIVDDPAWRLVLGASARYRRWLGSRLSADAAVGALRMPVGVVVERPYGTVRESVQRPALTADVRLGFADLFGVTGRAMVANDGRGRTHGALFAGVSVGSTVTALVTGTYAALIGTAYLRGGHGDDVTLVSTTR